MGEQPVAECTNFQLRVVELNLSHSMNSLSCHYLEVTCTVTKIIKLVSMHVWKENLSRLKKLMFVVGITEFLRFTQTSLVRFNT